MYLGHGGEPCPTTRTGKGEQEVHSGSSDEEEGKDGGDGVPLAGWEKQDKQCLVIVDTLEIHQLRIGWCQCETGVDPHIQLLRNRWFPASTKWPSTAFTFSLLDCWKYSALWHRPPVPTSTCSHGFRSPLNKKHGL
jgi:hypothetical protein